MKAIGSSLPELSDHIPSFTNCRKRSHYIASTGEHHAIVPTDKAPDVSTLDAKETELYKLIASHYVSAHMEDCKEHHMTMIIEVEYSLFDNPKQTFIAKVLDRKTEPPRRISLGGLPEVMARLIELVTDPEQKKALENPVNPKEPKGLGTVASRKDVIETLLRRGYVSEKKGKGKDPLIEVTPLGMKVWQRLNKVYPDHASPVARAVFEGNLALIGMSVQRQKKPI